MTSITEELIRKRAEHNEGQISSLEEIALHQQDIMKIDHIQQWCKNLKILLLQSNIISKIENLNKLKKLEYLNLAINNVERIENLEGCESLRKLDLTLNFIGELTSVETLKNNYNLRELYLTGNSCSKFEGYLEYVITVLPQINILDGIQIFPSDRILAKQNFSRNILKIFQQQNEYLEKRQLQKNKSFIQKTKSTHFDQQESMDFWKQTTENSPEIRLAMAEQIRKSHEKITINMLDSKISKRKIKLFKEDGCPLNVNEAKIPFSLEEQMEYFILTVDIYKHLDTSLVDVDVQPWFVRVLIKGKVLQLVLKEEVYCDKSTAQRTICSRRLVITMPKLQKNKIMKFHEKYET